MLIGLYIMPSLHKKSWSQGDPRKNLLLDGDGQFFDLVFAVDLSLGCPLINELFLFVFIDIAADNRIEVSLLPEEFGSLCLLDFRVEHRLLIVVFQVAIGHHIVVSLGSVLYSFASRTFLLCWLRAFVRRLEVMVLHVNVADNVVVDDGVFALAEIPRLILRVVWAVL